MARASIAGRLRMRRLNWVGISASVVLIVALLSRLVWWFVVQRLPNSDFEMRAAAFGDIAGAVFSALAFAGLIVTALMQREELALQRKQLSETQGELKRAADAEESTMAALRAQAKVARVAAHLNAAIYLLDRFNELDQGSLVKERQELLAEILLLRSLLKGDIHGIGFDKEASEVIFSGMDPDE